MSYQLDCNINPNKAFVYDPIPEISLDECKELPSDWRNKLGTDCKFSIAEQRAFAIHMDPEYKHHSDLLHHIRIIYHRLFNHLDDQLGLLSDNERTSIIAKLKEEITACRPGFHNRVNTIVDSFRQPNNLQQLLFKIRMGLVEKAAASLTNEVHARNRCFILANVDGLGVNAILSNDPYQGAVSDENIREALIKVFLSEYCAFQLPFLLVDMLRGIFIDYGYKGKNEAGYGFGVYGKIKNYLNQIQLDRIKLDKHSLELNFTNLFIVESTKQSEQKDDDLSDKESEESYKIIDVDWKAIAKLFFNALRYVGIVKQTARPLTLQDCAWLSKLYSQSNSSDLFGCEDAIIANTFHDLHKSEKQVKSLIDILNTIRKHHQEYHAKLIEIYAIRKIANRIVLTSLPLIKKAVLENDECLFKKWIVSVAYFLRYVDENKTFIKKIRDLLLVTSIDKNNVLALAVSWQSPVVAPLLDFIDKHIQALGVKKVKTVITQSDKNGLNTLMFAAKYQPAAVAPFLSILCKVIQNSGIETVIAVIAQSNNNGWNAIMLAVMHQSDAVALLLNFLSEHIQNLGAETIKGVIMQRNKDGSNAMMLAAEYNPASMALFLNFLIEHFQDLGVETVKGILAQTTTNRSNALLVAAIEEPAAVLRFLIFLKNHFQGFGVETVKTVFALNDKYGRNASILTKQYQLSVATQLSGFYSKIIDETETKEDANTAMAYLSLEPPTEETTEETTSGPILEITPIDQVRAPRMKFFTGKPTDTTVVSAVAFSDRTGHHL